MLNFINDISHKNAILENCKGIAKNYREQHTQLQAKYLALFNNEMMHFF